MRYLVYTYELEEGERTQELVEVVLATEDPVEANAKVQEILMRHKTKWEERYAMVELLCDARKQQWSAIPVGYDRAFIVGLMDEQDPATTVHPARLGERADVPSITLFEAHASFISMKRGRRSGQPCVRETRLTVHDVLGQLVTDHCVLHEILSDFPELTHNDINCCLEYVRTFLVPPHSENQQSESEVRKCVFCVNGAHEGCTAIDGTPCSCGCTWSKKTAIEPGSRKWVMINP